MKKMTSKSKSGLKAKTPLKAKKIQIVEEEIQEQVEETLSSVNEQREFREGDVLMDKSSGKRFQFHNQTVVMAEPERFEIVG